MSAVSDFLDHLGAMLLTDESKIVLPVLGNYTKSLAADPSLINLAAQKLAFDNAMIALGPQAASTAIRDTATSLQTIIDVQLPALIASTANSLQPQPVQAPQAAAPTASNQA